MKQLFASAALAVCFSFPALAQTEQGSRMYSWNIGLDMTRFSSDSNFPTASESRGFVPQLTFGYQRGRFIRDHVAQGWLVDLYTQVAMGRSASERTRVGFFSPQFSVGYWRRYYLPSTAPVRFFAQSQLKGSYAGFYSRQQNDQFEPGTQLGSLTGGVDVGVTLFLKNGWAVEARQGLGIVSLSREFKSKQTGFNFNGGFGLGIFGIQIARYFGGSTIATTSLWDARQTIYQVNDRFIGGGFSGSVASDRPGSNTNLMLTKGRFKRADQARGVSFALGYSNRRVINTNVTYREGVFRTGISPFREYYWPLGQGNWSVLVNAGLNLSYAGTFRRIEFTAPGTSTAPTNSYQLSMNVALRPGIQYQISPKWAIVATAGSATFGELAVNVNRTKDAYTSTNSQTRLNLTPMPILNLNSLGISLRYFPRRTETRQVE